MWLLMVVDLLLAAREVIRARGRRAKKERAGLRAGSCDPIAVTVVPGGTTEVKRG
jgi:hypothetical protein